MKLKSFILCLLLIFTASIQAQNLMGYYIGQHKDSIQLDAEKWEIIEDDNGTTAFQFNGEHEFFMQIALSFTKEGILYNINSKTKSGVDVTHKAYKYIFDNFKGGKTDIIGSCKESSIKKMLWVNENTKLDYKETCHGNFQATINWMKIR